MRRLAMDFDGVVAENVGFPEIGKVKDGVKDAITEFRKKGYQVYIHTARSDPWKVKDWLHEQGFPDMEVTNTKLPADVYIDDRAYRLTDWSRRDTNNILSQAKEDMKPEDKLRSYLSDYSSN